EAGMDAYGFKVRDAKTLERFTARLNEYGVATELMPRGELLETGERVRFVIPTGHTIELYADKTDVGNGQSYLNPEPWIPNLKGIAPLRLDHALLYGCDLDGSRALFEEVLDFTLVERVLMRDDKTDLAVFLSCSTKSHDVALVRHDEDDKLHHVSFLLETWEQVVRAGDILAQHGVSVDIGPTRHGATRGATIYAFDSSGNRFETFCGGYDHYPDMKPVVWTSDEAGPAIFFHDRKLNDRFLSVVT
ncbi:MAG: catechol 2,3-dioxygenase, partial [Desulfobacterales bacterium]|nr:catechol 2,3-dioxygenase [Desulfobacterales bacterium]